MATTITYKGSNLTSFSNTSKTLRTAGKYLEGDITITAGLDVNNQNKTVIPSEASQSITADTGYTGLGTVTVNGITNTYVGSSIPRKSGTDVATSFVTQGANTYYAINIPGGYYENGGVNNQPTRSTTVIPSETSITVSSASNSILKDVIVTAITPTYVGSGVTTNTSLTVSANTITANAGYYADSVTYTMPYASLNTERTFTVSPGQISVDENSGIVTVAATTSGVGTVRTHQTSGYLKATGNSDESNSLLHYRHQVTSATYQLPTLPVQTFTPSSTTQTVASTGKYMLGDITVQPIPSQYIVPSGTLTISSVDTTTTFDATSYASVAVNLKDADVTAY